MLHVSRQDTELVKICDLQNYSIVDSCSEKPPASIHTDNKEM